MMASAPTVITIDGPASSGKSTLGQKLAEKLGYLYFDTGCLYRAVTLAALRRGLPVTDADTMAGLALELDIQVTPPGVSDGRQYTVLVEKIDVTWELRNPETDATVSIISAFPEVRRTLTERMRAIARAGRIVMVGRPYVIVDGPNIYHDNICLDCEPGIRHCPECKKGQETCHKHGTRLCEECQKQMIKDKLIKWTNI